MSPTEPMRLFIGTALPAHVSASLTGQVQGFLSDPRWRAAPVEQWHVTALFIGERPAGQLERIQAEVERIASGTPHIRLSEGRLITMPKDAPYMLWVRFTPHPALTALHHALAQATGTAPSAYVPYWPHITLARTARTNAPAHNGDIVLPELMLDHLTLFRSQLAPGGMAHTPLYTWPLS